MTVSLPDWLSAIASCFESAGLCWGFRRSPLEILSAAAAGPDVDVWCSKEDAERMFAILSQEGWRLVAGWTAWPAYPVPDGTLCRFEAGAQLHSLEVMIGGERWGPFIAFREEEVRAKLGRNGFYPHYQGDLALAIATTRVLLMKPAPSMRLASSRGAWSAAEVGDRTSWRIHTKRMVGARLARRIVTVLDGEGRPSAGLRVQLTMASLVRQPRAVLVLLRWLVRKARGVLRPMNGPIIAFIGTDGAGKSSAIRAVTEHLVSSNIHAVAVYLGRSRYNTSPVRIVRNAWLNTLGTPGPANGSGESSRARIVDLLVRNAAAFLYAFDMRVRIVKARRSVPEFGCILVDRGPDDLMTMQGTVRLLSLARALGPSIDLTILCDAPTEVILARKAERSPEVAAAQQSLYRRLAQARADQGRAVLLDTSTPEPNLAPIMRAIRLACQVRSRRLDQDLLPLVNGRSLG